MHNNKHLEATKMSQGFMVNSIPKLCMSVKKRKKKDNTGFGI